MSQVNPSLIIEKNVVFCKENPITIEQISSNGVDLRINEDLILYPHKCKNVEIMERFCLDGVIGCIWIRSSFSRKGVFLSSGLFDDGFGLGVENGAIGGVTLYNFSDVDIEIEKGTRICQMVFFESTPSKKYNGFYNKNQTIQSQFDKK